MLSFRMKRCAASLVVACLLFVGLSMLAPGARALPLGVGSIGVGYYSFTDATYGETQVNNALLYTSASYSLSTRSAQTYAGTSSYGDGKLEVASAGVYKVVYSASSSTYSSLMTGTYSLVAGILAAGYCDVDASYRVVDLGTSWSAPPYLGTSSSPVVAQTDIHAIDLTVIGTTTAANSFQVGASWQATSGHYYALEAFVIADAWCLLGDAYASTFGNPGLAYTQIQVFGEVGSPTLVSPANGATWVPLTTTLSWNAVTGATSYEFMIWTGSLQNPTWGPVYTPTTATSIVKTLSPGVTWSWAVYAVANGVWGVISLQRSFTTCNVPTLLSPANGATWLPLTTTLSWTAVSGANDYKVVVFTSTWTSKDWLTTGTSMTLSYDPSTTWSWHVAASPDNGVTWGSWSATWTFTTCGVTTLLKPANGATGVADTSTLSWTKVSGANYYAIEIFTPSNGWSVTRYSSTTSIALSFDPGITWSWHVKASRDSGATYGSWSATWTFTTK